MHTTFRSLRKGAPCSDGSRRFIDIIGGSSKNLPHGLDTRIPYWLPLLMNPGDDEDIGWMFKTSMTYVHRTDDFRYFLTKTRDMVARYCCIMFTTAALGASHSGANTFDLDCAKDMASRPEQTAAIHALALAAQRCLREGGGWNSEEMRTALDGFEATCSNLLHYPHEVLDAHGPGGGSSRPQASKEHLGRMMPLWRLVVNTDDDGPVRHAVFEQKYYAHCVLTNLHKLLVWHEGVRLVWTETTRFEQKGSDKSLKRPPMRRRTSTGSAASRSTADEWEPKTPRDLEGIYDFKLAYLSAEFVKQQRDTGRSWSTVTRENERANERARLDVVEGEEIELELMEDEDDGDGEDDTDSDTVSSLASIFKKPQNTIVRWVYCTLDTSAFFGTLKFAGEHALPATGVSLEWLQGLRSLAQTAVYRDEAGKFVAGIVAVKSPRLMAMVMQFIRQKEGADIVTEPGLGESFVAAPPAPERAPAMAPAPVLMDPAPARAEAMEPGTQAQRDDNLYADQLRELGATVVPLPEAPRSPAELHTEAMRIIGEDLTSRFPDCFPPRREPPAPLQMVDLPQGSPLSARAARGRRLRAAAGANAE